MNGREGSESAVVEASTLIQQALAAGVGAAAGALATAAARDAYEALKAAVRRRLQGRPGADMVLARHESNPQAWGEVLRDELVQAEADKDLDLIRAAQTFLTMVNPQQAALGKFNVQAQRDVHTVIQGDQMQVHLQVPPPPGRTAAQKSPMMDVKRGYQQFLARLEVEWAVERDSDPVGFEEGQLILTSAYQRILDFRTDLSDQPGYADAVAQLDNAAKRIKALINDRRIKLMGDGGQFFRYFWAEGSEIVNLLKDAARLIIM